jgi:hypothetical protein
LVGRWESDCETSYRRALLPWSRLRSIGEDASYDVPTVPNCLQKPLREFLGFRSDEFCGGLARPPNKACSLEPSVE